MVQQFFFKTLNNQKAHEVHEEKLIAQMEFFHIEKFFIEMSNHFLLEKIYSFSYGYNKIQPVCNGPWRIRGLRD